MPGRRRILGLGITAASLTAAGAAYAVAGIGRGRDYDEAARATWQGSGLPDAGLEHRLVRAATLAANSHNTQPWRFSLGANRIGLQPDPARRCPAVDPDDHHLFVSLGCAVENIVQAAQAAGAEAFPTYNARGGGIDDGGIDVDIRPAATRETPLAAAIAQRQSTRADYDGRPLSSAELDRLAAAGRDRDVDLMLVTDRGGMEKVLAAVIEGDTAQVNDPAYVAELRHWLRFSYNRALATRDGLFTACTGNPVAPELVGTGLFRLFYTAASENRKYVGQVRSSSGIAILAARSEGREGWIAAGRAFQRFALQATAMELKLSLLNCPIEVAAIRPQFAAAMGFGGRRPDMIVRFGRGPSLPQSLRRDVGQVLA